MTDGNGETNGSSWRSRLGGAVLITATLAFVSACGSAPEARSGPSSGSVTEQAPSSSPSAAVGTTPPSAGRGGAESVPAPGGTAPTVAAGLQPVRITIPAIGVSSRLVDLGIASDGTIEVPSVPAMAGWLDTSPAPGQQGPAVIAGHVDSDSGPAVFYRLRELKQGDAIVVTRRDGTQARFTVDGVGAYSKKHFPTQATYGPVPGPALRLITCGGSYDKSQGGYLDNIVVFAT